jgi:hypothetical protein
VVGLVAAIGFGGWGVEERLGGGLDGSDRLRDYWAAPSLARSTQSPRTISRECGASNKSCPDVATSMTVGPGRQARGSTTGRPRPHNCWVKLPFHWSRRFTRIGIWSSMVDRGSLG